MHERLVIDPVFINGIIPTLRMKVDLVGKRLYFWGSGTADNIAVLTYNGVKDSLLVSAIKARDSGFTPVPEKIKKEIRMIVPPKTGTDYRFIYDMDGKELIYDLTKMKPIRWFNSYPPEKIELNKHYIVLWDELSIDGKTISQKIFRLAQDSDNLVGLANFFNRSEELILTSTATKCGLDYSFLLIAHTFGLPLRTSSGTFLDLFCENYKRGANKLDTDNLHENFENIILESLAEEEEDKGKKELIGGGEEGSKVFSLTEILVNGFPSVDNAEIFIDNYDQKGFPVKISGAHISDEYLVLYADEEIYDYYNDLKKFRTIFGFERIILIDIDDTEYEEYRKWLH